MSPPNGLTSDGLLPQESSFCPPDRVSRPVTYLLGKKSQKLKWNTRNFYFKISWLKRQINDCSGNLSNNPLFTVI